MKRSGLGYNFSLTPLLLMLPMLFTTDLKTHNTTLRFACKRGTIARHANRALLFVNPYSFCVFK